MEEGLWASHWLNTYSQQNGLKELELILASNVAGFLSRCVSNFNGNEGNLKWNIEEKKQETDEDKNLRELLSKSNDELILNRKRCWQDAQLKQLEELNTLNRGAKRNFLISLEDDKTITPYKDLLFKKVNGVDLDTQEEGLQKYVQNGNEFALICKEEGIQKEFGQEMILKQLFNPLALQALHGDIFIDLNFTYADSQLFAQPSLMNQYKQLTSVEQFEERGLVELNLQSNYKPVTDYANLASALSQHKDYTLRQLGNRLNDFQIITKKMKQAEQQWNNTCTSKEEVEESLHNTYLDFQIFAREKLAEIKVTNKIFFYTLRQLNLKSFAFEIKKYGYSSDFLQLLGYNSRSFSNLAVRKGMIELQNFQGRIALNKMSLDVQLGQAKDFIRLKTSYLTSDNLELQVDGVVYQIFQNPSHKSLPFPHSEFLSVVVLDVQSEAMKKIYSIRQANKSLLTQQILFTHKTNLKNSLKQNQLDNKKNSSSEASQSSSSSTNPVDKTPSQKAYAPNTSVFGGPAFPPILPTSNEGIDVDEYYSMETQILLERFYFDKKNAKRKVHRIKRNQLLEDRKEVTQIMTSYSHILSSKTCGYRYIRKK